MHFLFLLVLTFWSSLSPILAEDENKYKIELFQGREIAPYTQKVIELCHMIYREPPYNYNGDSAEYESYLESYSQSTDAVTCLVFDNDKKAIGLAIGIPMSQTRDSYKTSLLEKGYLLNDLFYIGEFGLSSKYRQQGIEEKMYEKIEAFAKKRNFKKLCLWEIGNFLDSTQDSKYYLDTFWKKVGFILYPEINFSIYWTDIGSSNSTQHNATYWIKPL